MIAGEPMAGAMFLLAVALLWIMALLDERPE